MQTEVTKGAKSEKKPQKLSVKIQSAKNLYTVIDSHRLIFLVLFISKNSLFLWRLCHVGA